MLGELSLRVLMTQTRNSCVILWEVALEFNVLRLENKRRNTDLEVDFDAVDEKEYDDDEHQHRVTCVEDLNILGLLFFVRRHGEQDYLQHQQ